MAQHPSQCFPCQPRPPLLQPEVTAHQQQHPTIDQLRHVVQLHQALCLTQADKGFCVTILGSFERRQTEVAIQGALVLALQAHLQALPIIGSRCCVLTQASRQTTQAQSDAPGQQSCMAMPGLKQLLGFDQQTLCPPQGASLLEQLCMVEFENHLQQYRALSPSQAQGVAQVGLRVVQLAAQQRLLDQTTETRQA
ncbi:hypothetical protein D3C76_1278730 [compost metagenome]